MDFFFADDSRQANPTRPGMGPLVAIGGIHVPDQEVLKLEKAIGKLCTAHGFPHGEEFKWSPGRELWMWENIREEDRQRFFIEVLTLCKVAGVKVLVVIEDTKFKPAIKRLTPEMDVASLFLERVNLWLGKVGREGVIIVDRPGGGRGDEDKFLSKCLETIEAGTDYVKPDHIAINVLSTPSKLVRLLQVADLVTSCTLAFVGGEERFSQSIFNLIKELLCKNVGKIGGVGLKIHPFKYVNLYHWLLSESYYLRGCCTTTLPLWNRPYYSDPRKP